MSLQDDINREILRNVNWDNVAKKVLTDDFLATNIKDKLLGEFNAPFRERTKIEFMIEQCLVAKFVEKHADEILARLNMDSIVNAVTYKVATAVKGRLDG